MPSATFAGHTCPLYTLPPDSLIMTERELLRYDQTLFQDVEVFEHWFVPGEVPFRDAQISELAMLARPGVHGARPGNAFLRGPPGTGKTTTVRRLFAEIEETTGRIVPVYVNCQHDRTRAAVFAKVLERLASHPLPGSGTPLSELQRKVAKVMQEKECALLVCLDDAQYLHFERELNGVLYTLLRLHESYGKASIGVFAVTSDMDLDLRASVDTRVFSVFHPVVVEFPAYSSGEIREILAARVRQGLFPNVMEKKAFELAATIAAREQDVRAGIDIVWQAALRAEKDARKAVTREDVLKAARFVVSPTLRARAERFRESERKLLCRLSEIGRSGEVLTAGNAFRAVREGMQIGYTTFHEKLKRFEGEGLLDLRICTERGRTREIRLRFDPEEMIAACEESEYSAGESPP
ncbi:MAG: ORC1-type DNA replication protein [Methanomicrobiaceae archaeon]|nr:ORC1-type DNA replication protein [Methanomicrobiaceae archaeon]